MSFFTSLSMSPGWKKAFISHFIWNWIFNWINVSFVGCTRELSAYICCLNSRTFLIYMLSLDRTIKHVIRMFQSSHECLMVHFISFHTLFLFPSQCPYKIKQLLNWKWVVCLVIERLFRIVIQRFWNPNWLSILLENEF